MDETRKWREMFERTTGTRPPETGHASAPPAATQPNPLGGFDDGFQPPATPPPKPEGDAFSGPRLMSPAEIADEAALALADDGSEYRPWILQRGVRPALMLHLRRHDPKSGLWIGWELSYPHLVAVEYTGDRLLSLDFGARQFMLEGTGLDELARQLQTGNVLMVQEYDPSVWPAPPGGARVSAIRRLTTNNER